MSEGAGNGSRAAERQAIGLCCRSLQAGASGEQAEAGRAGRQPGCRQEEVLPSLLLTSGGRWLTGGRAPLWPLA